MNDRELLEAAALAAGIVGEWDESHKSLMVGTPFRGVASMMNYEPWNPLLYDGDALRLASKMKLDVYFHECGAMVNTESGSSRDEQGPDALASARRAIVRAAAAIGSATP